MTNERTSVENLKCKDPTFSRLLEKQKKTTSFSLTKRIVTLTESLKCQKLFHVLLPIQKVENYVLFRLGLGKTLPSTLLLIMPLQWLKVSVENFQTSGKHKKLVRFDFEKNMVVGSKEIFSSRKLITFSGQSCPGA